MERISDLLKGKRLLIFDFDGTIANTSPLHAAAFEKVLSPLGVSVDYAAIAGRKTLDAMQICLANAGIVLPMVKVKELVNDKQSIVRQMIAESLTPLSEIDEFLHWAKPRYPLAMVTSGSRGTVELALHKLGYLGWFQPILFAEDVRKAKPDPEGFLHVLAITGISANEAIVFEDSQAGFDAAFNAGITYIDVNTVAISLLH